MYVIVNNEPASFLCEEDNLRILDSNKKDFYFHPNKEKKLNFNLPVGKYYVNNIIFRKPEFTPYISETPLIPIPEKYKDGMKIVFGDNKHKATVFRNEGRILVDKKFNKEILWYEPALVFLLGHELSHYVIPDYKDVDMRESLCDKNSRALMYKLGYNPSQITIACKMLLSSDYRKHCIENTDTGQNFRK